MTELESMKYSELQRLAKKLGIKANMKFDKLLKAIQDHQQQTEVKELNEDKTNTENVEVSPEKSSREINNSASPQVITFSNKTPSSSKSKPKILSRNATPVMSKTPLGTPKERRSSGRKRTSTYNLEEGTVPSPKIISETTNAAGPMVQKMKDCMKPDMTTEQMKDSLKSVLDMDKSKTESNSSIPRFAAFAAMRKKEMQQKSITPGNKNWAQIHQKHFDKMDSLDVYLDKKRKRTETITASMKKAKLLAEETKATVDSLKSVLSPADRKSKLELFRSPSMKTAPFQPKVTSTTKMDTNFSKSADFQSLKPVKTAPVQKSVKIPDTKSISSSMNKTLTLSMSTMRSNRKSLGAIQNRKSMDASKISTSVKKVAPLSIGTSKPDSTKKSKPKFDLAASLSKPLTWKPYTGKLKAMDNKKTNIRVDPKDTKLRTKDSRRLEMKSHQAEKRAAMKMKKRGLHV